MVNDGPVVYFIQAEEGGPIKIGTCGSTEGLTARLAGIQTGNPSRLRIRKTIPGGYDVETELHRRFAKYRLEGEWFLPAPSVVKESEGLGFRKGDIQRPMLRVIEKAFEAGRVVGNLEADEAFHSELRGLLDGWRPQVERDDMRATVDRMLADIDAMRGEYTVEMSTSVPHDEAGSQ